jgi:putative transposase
MCLISQYERTAGPVHGIGWQIVWCPTYHKKILMGQVADRLGNGSGRRGWNTGCTLESLEPDHVHAFVRIGPATSAAPFVHRFKATTSRILRSEFAHVRSRLPTLRPRSHLVASACRMSEATIRRHMEEQPAWPRQEKRR